MASIQSPTRICVFTSTTTGRLPAHTDAARDLAKVLHEHSAELIYGGGTSGLMGELSKAFVGLSGKDRVQGLIPLSILPIERPESVTATPMEVRQLGKKKWTDRLSFATRRQKSMIAPDNPSSQYALPSEEKYGMATVVPSLSAREQLMCSITSSGTPGSGFIALSGGFGTMDELTEMITWRQQGVHNCRICLYNVDGFWDMILAWIESAIQRGFVREEVRDWVGEGWTGEECVKWLAEGNGARG